jgi:hypothetical protein
VLRAISAWSRWSNSGGPVKWDSAFSAAVGGYPRGAIVQSATTFGRVWVSTADDNTSNPDAGGANWVLFQTFIGGGTNRGYIDGVVLANSSTNAIAFGAGAAADSTATYIMETAGLTKRLDQAWTAGSGVGGLFSGSVANATWYHCFLIRKTSDGTIDAGFDTSLTAANIPTGYSSYRRVGSIKTDIGTTSIRLFLQRQGCFMWQDTHLNQLAAGTAYYDYFGVPGGTAVDVGLLWTPPGVVTEAILSVSVTSGALSGIAAYVGPSGTAAYWDNYVTANGIPGTYSAAGPGVGVGALQRVLTDTSPKVITSGLGNAQNLITTLGYYDFRGQNA